ncbi:group II intron reverse transcriptase/maturase [Brevibacillus fluminis]|uniref:Group II intron reverse transcriptase/maturase n=1 Tax=Brevibacillus fluminis TaxID=511487 RepID=A0A3M8DWK6_9BACL|nr:reverse transcriptase domain-containing protein [Brevibacillus fluminis]RNB92482.1 group II intron reverse transcriptase/maturase [Brevibacillus fluminis]
MARTRRFQIPKKMFWEAYKQSEKTKVVGVDGQTIQYYKRNRIKLVQEQWDQLTSGNYIPSPVRRAFIPKKKGGRRPIGIPTVKDFIVQTVLKNNLSPKLEVLFHPSSFGYKQNSRAREDAIRMAGNRCLRYDWALVLDIKQFGDNIDHQLLMNMLKKHIQNKWVLLYTHRMMKAPVQTRTGALIKPEKGLAQGSKLNFLLGNFYLHNIFDEWMQKNHPEIPFERYTDDIICHCKSESIAKRLLSQIQERLGNYKLVTNPEKTKIVYCKDAARKRNYANVSFDFLGATFCSRKMKTKSGNAIARFMPKIRF